MLLLFAIATATEQLEEKKPCLNATVIIFLLSHGCNKYGASTKRDLTQSIPALYPNIQMTYEQCRLIYTMDHRRIILMFSS